LTCSAVAKATKTALLLLLVGCASSPPRDRADLTNPFLGPEYTGWLIGPVSRLATPEEIQAFQAITTDEQAGQFVEAFWAKRDPNGDAPGNPVRQAFEQRADHADRAFTEAGYRGRRTDRGAVFILYGPPKKLDYEVSPSPGEPPLEVWIYDETSPSGLDGRRPANLYRFIKRGDLTVTYSPGRTDPRLRHRPDQSPDPFP